MSRPRLAFVGLGWIGAMRLDAVARSGRAEIRAICDADPARLAAVRAAHPAAEVFVDQDALLEHGAADGLDGIVVATPNALHAAQVLQALERGIAVFCQKPLALDAAEARMLTDAAQRADRLLGVDYSYRHTDGARALKAMLEGGELGRVFAIETAFHNAYGPDKAWCWDVALAGGGALMDLGVHQIDMVLWLLDRPVKAVHGCVFREGEPLATAPGIDDFATARLELEGGAAAHMAVSWHAHVGRDCVIRTTAFGTAGGAELRNVAGSFYDFELVRFQSRTEERRVGESRDWLGRGIVEWVTRLAESSSYDPGCERSVAVSAAVDAIYAASARPARALA